MKRKRLLSDQPVHTFVYALAGGGQVNISIYGSGNKRQGECFIVDDVVNIMGTFIKCRFGARNQMEKCIRNYIQENKIPVTHLLREEHYIGYYLPHEEGDYRLITEFFSTNDKKYVRAKSFIFNVDGVPTLVRRRLVALSIKSHGSMLFYANRLWNAVDLDSCIMQ